MPERDTAAGRLARILHLLPLCARDEGARTEELAAALGITEAEVLRDVQELVAREFYHPAGSGDDLQITIEPDRVHIWTKGEFRRPVRLSPHETLALGLGLRALACEAEPARRTELLARARRLEAALAALAFETPHQAGGHGAPRNPPDPRRAGRPHVEKRPASDERRRPDADAGSAPSSSFDAEAGSDAAAVPPDADRFVTVLAAEDDDILGLVIDAARERRRCRIRYLKAGAAAPDERRIDPYLLAFAEGRWYLLAHAPERDAVRVFRIDRIIEAETEAQTFTVPDDFDPSRYIADGRVYRAEDDIEVAVRYSPAIARWLAERLPCEPLPDGSVVARHRVADPSWVVRHVLQYGADAEVLAPEAVRRRVGEAAERVGAG